MHVGEQGGYGKSSFLPLNFVVPGLQLGPRLPPSCDNQRHLLTLPNVSWWTALSLVEKQWYRGNHWLWTPV